MTPGVCSAVGEPEAQDAVLSVILVVQWPLELEGWQRLLSALCCSVTGICKCNPHVKTNLPNWCRETQGLPEKVKLVTTCPHFVMNDSHEIAYMCQWHQCSKNTTDTFLTKPNKGNLKMYNDGKLLYVQHRIPSTIISRSLVVGDFTWNYFYLLLNFLCYDFFYFPCKGSRSCLLVRMSAADNGDLSNRKSPVQRWFLLYTPCHMVRF